MTADIKKLIYQAGASGQVTLEDGTPVSATDHGPGVSDFSVADRIFAHLRLHAVVGAPTVTVKIQHSDDGVTYSDLGAFSAATGDWNETIQAATPKAYLRAAWTVSGSGSCKISVNIVAIAGSRLSGIPVTVAGHRNDPEGALKALLTALAAAGVITDTTTAS